MSFREFIIFISGKPEIKVTEDREGGTFYLGYGNDRHIRFRLNRQNPMDSKLDFNIMGVKGNFQYGDDENSQGSQSSGVSYGSINDKFIIRILSKSKNIF